MAAARLSFGVTKGRSGSTTTTPDRDLPGTAPPILAAGVIYAAAGGLALGTDGPALTMIVGVAGTGAFALALAGGLLGHRVAAAMPPPAGGCAGFSCRGAG